LGETTRVHIKKDKTLKKKKNLQAFRHIFSAQRNHYHSFAEKT
jgi:hypothetical protein